MTAHTPKIATLIRTLKHEDWTGTAKLYRLKPRLNKKTYVVVSATVAMFSGAETYIFPANKKGEITNYSEMEGSYRGGLDHEEALRGAGYEVQS